MDNLTKYPKTDEGRRNFIHDSLLWEGISDEHAVKPINDMLNKIAGVLIFIVAFPIYFPTSTLTAMKKFFMPALQRKLNMQAKYLQKKRKEVPRDKFDLIAVILFIISLTLYLIVFLS
jgi:hypothetical protein